ncbi:Fatty acid desaturase [Pseudomonas synxantha]|nr:Fatty acid desaturase [Pseudomonas synxantha]
MANYLDQTHRREIQALTARFTVKSEWPTWLLLFGVYAGWFGVLLASRWLGLWCSTLLLIPLVTLWLSLQHELLHGHPTRFPWVNKLLGYAPFAVWYPYTLYRDSHLLHHHDEDLTLPGIDPESRYLNQQQWDASSRLQRSVHWLTKTVVGRLLLAPPLGISR